MTVTINEGGLLMVYGPSASATINGTIISKGAYTGDITGYVIGSAAGFTYQNGKSIDIAGTINAKKATNETDTSVMINGDSEISGTVTIDAKAKAEFGGETKIVEGGVLNINGTYAGTILNQGTVNLNGSVSAGAVVSMNSTAAVLNVTALKGDNSLIVNDNGLYLQTDDNGNRIIVGETAGTTMNAITLNNVKGVTVTEGYTYTTDDGRTFVSVRPERIIRIDEPTLNEWLLDTAQSAWTRLKWMKQVVSLPDAKVPDLIKMGMSPVQAEGMLYALDNYGEMPDSSVYLKTIQNALRRLLPEKDVDFGFPEGMQDMPDEIDLDGDESGGAVNHGQMEDIVLSLLEELDTDGKGAPRDELERRAEAEGISAIELEEISNILMDKGLVYEPNLRYLKLI